MAKIIVTSGATREYIDEVRFISNISTGRLGSLIAGKAACSGFEVLYIHGENAALPEKQGNITTKPVRSVEDLINILKESLQDPEIKAVIHPMAVSDFTPSEKKHGKISSSAEKVIIELIPTPKAVQAIKKLRPDIFLISFKLESGIEETELIEKAQAQVLKTKSDLVVANLFPHTGPHDHKGFFVDREGLIKTVTGKSAIASEIVSMLGKNIS